MSIQIQRPHPRRKSDLARHRPRADLRAVVNGATSTAYLRPRPGMPALKFLSLDDVALVTWCRAAHPERFTDEPEAVS
jgi:hypothetical protein